MRVSIFGLGYVGAVTAGCLASRGHSVVGVDPQQAKVDSINSGRSPIQEKGLDDLLGAAVRDGLLRATTDPAEAVDTTELSVVCVGTPSGADGGLDLTYVRAVAGEIGAAIDGKATRAGDGHGVHRVVFRSTMLPGSTRALAESLFGALRAAGKAEVYFYPEFLREGSAIADFHEPSLAVMGAVQPETALAELDGFIEAGTHAVDLEVAEMVKYACNSFHALKVTFANEIGRVARDAGVDGREVMRLVCQDTRLNISPRYLRPGNPYGGSCLPKDVSALLQRAGERRLELPLVESLKASNDIHLAQLEQRVIGGCQARVARGIDGGVAILGVAFKRGTDDLRGSPMLELAARLHRAGITVRVYDPYVDPTRLVGANAGETNRVFPGLASVMTASAAEAVKGTAVVVAGFKCASKADLAGAAMAGQLVIDLTGWAELSELPWTVEGICW